MGGRTLEKIDGLFATPQVQATMETEGHSLAVVDEMQNGLGRS